MNDSYPQSFLDRVSQYGTSFVRLLIENYPASTQWDAATLSSAWQLYKEQYDSLALELSGDVSFDSKNRELRTINDVRLFAENNQIALPLCDHAESFFMELLQDTLKPCNFSCNASDVEFRFVLHSYCVSREPEDGQTKDLSVNYFDESSCRDIKRTTIPHISTPFILMLIRYTYYHRIVHKMVEDVNFRRNPRNAQIFDFAGVTKVDWGKYSPREVCEQYAITHFGGGLKEIREYDALHITRQEDVPHEWYLTLVENEGRRLREDYTYLQKHFDRRFVASLMEWHKFYFDYLVECLHNCEEYKDYPIEKLVPPMKLEKIKPKLIDENRALTPLGKSYRRAVVAKIQECKTAADYGALLYKLQYDLGWFTKNRLSRNEYYLVMQQLGKVTFGSSGDFSNCNKGFYQADKEASKR